MLFSSTLDVQCEFQHNLKQFYCLLCVKAFLTHPYAMLDKSIPLAKPELGDQGSLVCLFMEFKKSLNRQ